MIKGNRVDDHTRCVHYHSPLDIIAIKFRCCNEYYPCFECHAETAGHDPQVWLPEEFDTAAIFCGNCKTELSINEYLACGNQCPHCGSCSTRDASIITTFISRCNKPHVLVDLFLSEKKRLTNTMTTATRIAKLFRDVHFGGNWTAVNLKDTLEDVDWTMAITRVHSFNTIATLVYHMNYYIHAITAVLDNEPLTAKDKYSFDHPPILSQLDWAEFLHKIWSDAEGFADRVGSLPDEIMDKIFVNEKYGSYYRNLHGIIEHTHYHLGQIILIKKILREKA